MRPPRPLAEQHLCPPVSGDRVAAYVADIAPTRALKDQNPRPSRLEVMAATKRPSWWRWLLFAD
jgi:hypothetical protein